MDEQDSATRGRPNAGAPPRKLATAKILVERSEATPIDQITDPSLVEIRIQEMFSGDIDGFSSVRALQVREKDGSAIMISMQRFRGRLGGRQGTFILHGSQMIKDGKIKATWFVVPNSATDDLSGLRGEGGFEGEFGKGSTGTLEYWFE